MSGTCKNRVIEMSSSGPCRNRIVQRCNTTWKKIERRKKKIEGRKKEREVKRRKIIIIRIRVWIKI